jgi:homoserine trans-succinylase
VDKLTEFELRAQRLDADPRELWAAFPFDEVAETVENSWASVSAILYGNWLKLAQAAVPTRV